MIDVEALANHVAAAIAGDGYLVGVGEAPKESGWTTGTPGRGTYKPYAVVLYAGGVPTGDQTLHGFARDWRHSFTVRTWGATHGQLLRVGRAWRTRLETWPSESPVVDDWRIANLEWGPLGPAEPRQNLTPTMWTSTDSLTLICTKS